MLKCVKNTHRQLHKTVKKIKLKQKDAYFTEMSQISASPWEKYIKKQNKREKLLKNGLHWGKDNFAQ